MPVVGYGMGSLRHGRLASFHATLAGHSLNYLSRGTYFSAEQRSQQNFMVTANGTELPLSRRFRNDCGVDKEDCSLCTVSAVASAFWVRWMLLMADPDDDVLFVLRGAPRRWYSRAGQQPFGVDRAPTRFGLLLDCPLGHRRRPHCRRLCDADPPATGLHVAYSRGCGAHPRADRAGGACHQRDRAWSWRGASRLALVKPDGLVQIQRRRAPGAHPRTWLQLHLECVVGQRFAAANRQSCQPRSRRLRD